MAAAKTKKTTAAVDLPECPVCLDTMTKPIFMCQSGHSLCNSCTTILCPPVCPICRQAMTQMRNWQLEEIVSKAKMPCPNKSSGCVYIVPADDADKHLKECIFRQMDCPLGVVFGRCSWSGKLTDMMEHFKERHQANCNVSSDAEVELDNISSKEDDRHVYLVAQAKLLFIVTMKIDTLQKMAYWTVQHIGSKKVAEQHIYEIHVTSKKDLRRKSVFIDHCFNDSRKADDIFREGKYCAMMPINMLDHFIKDKKMSFRFFIKRLPPAVNKNKENDDGKNDNKPPQKGPKGPGPKGPGPKGPGPNAPGSAHKPGPKKAYNKAQS